MASPAPKVVTFVTGNQNKLKEVRAILGNEYADKFVLEAKKVDLPELQGEPEDIAKEKASLAAKAPPKVPPRWPSGVSMP